MQRNPVDLDFGMTLAVRPRPPAAGQRRRWLRRSGCLWPRHRGGAASRHGQDAQLLSAFTLAAGSSCAPHREQRVIGQGSTKASLPGFEHTVDPVDHAAADVERHELFLPPNDHPGGRRTVGLQQLHVVHRVLADQPDQDAQDPVPALDWARGRAWPTAPLARSRGVRARGAPPAAPGLAVRGMAVIGRPTLINGPVRALRSEIAGRAHKTACRVCRSPRRPAAWPVILAQAAHGTGQPAGIAAWQCLSSLTVLAVALMISGRRGSRLRPGFVFQPSRRESSPARATGQPGSALRNLRSGITPRGGLKWRPASLKAVG